MANDWISIAVQSSGRAHPGSDFGGFFKSFRRGISGAFKGVAKGVGSVGNQLSKVPIVGGGLHAIYSVATGPIQLSANIATGQRIDKAVMGHLKSSVANVRDLAPYVQTIVSIVPGVGQGVSGAIGAASALAAGRRINDALAEGVKGALPGGPLARAAFEIAVAGIRGKPIDEIALAALPLSSDQKKGVVASVHAAKDIAHGKRVDESVFNAGKAFLPEQAQNALVIGIALAHAKNLQDIAKAGALAIKEKLPHEGAAIVASSSVLKTGVNALVSDGQQDGFNIAVGLMRHRVTRPEITAIRGSLTPVQKDGFDLAIAAHVGQLLHPLPSTVSPAERFGYYVTRGMKFAKPKNRPVMRHVLVKNTAMVKGMNAASVPQERGFWPTVRRFIIRRRGVVT